uniref:Profilin n=1 Tax=Populus trichocarpa TaxID=3694 RepID=A0A3N7G2V9_POPTR
MDWGFVHKAWEKWTSINVGSSTGEPLKAALLINYDPNAPSRLLSIIAEQEGINAVPTEVSQFVDFVKRNKLHSENFTIGQNQYPELGGQMWLHPFMRIVSVQGL